MKKVLLVLTLVLSLIFSADAFAASKKSNAKKKKAPPAPVVETKNRGFTIGDDIDAEDIQELDALGVNLVRYWCRPKVDVTSENKEQFLARVDGCLDNMDALGEYYTAAGIKLVFALDAPAPIYFATGKKPVHNVFVNADHQSWFIEAWGRVADRLYAASYIKGFDLLNEPANSYTGSGLLNWSNLAFKLIRELRLNGVTQNIYVESQFGNPILLREVERICQNAKKAGHGNIHGSFHFYSPFNYTHQGIGGRATGVAGPDAKEKKKQETVLKAATAAKSCEGIYVGEFGASAYATNRSDYFQWLIGYFETKGWDWTAHSFREAGEWDVEHDVDNTTNTLDLFKTYFNLNN
ncbi:MAG: cellulase family glycosylhydrolase [Proteobacteria bacterium]|nr:cellulase family glycosylhydrolase [Pseudomonadota bacterium]